LDFVIKEQILRRILETGNSAAHASTDGERRELKKSDADCTVELLRRAIFLFVNIAFAIAEKDPTTD
jgi:hypothetical protein